MYVSVTHADGFLRATLNKEFGDIAIVSQSEIIFCWVHNTNFKDGPLICVSYSVANYFDQELIM